MTDCKAAGVRTSAAEQRPRFCKARSHTPTHNGLVASAAGLVPCAQHDGLSPAHPARAVLQQHNKESGASSMEEANKQGGAGRRGRRHVDPATGSEGSASSAMRKTGKARVQRPDIHNALQESTNVEAGVAARKTGKARVLRNARGVCAESALPPQHTVVVPAGERRYSPSMAQQQPQPPQTQTQGSSAEGEKENVMERSHVCTDPARIARDMAKTSLEQAEARLRLLMLRPPRQTSPSPVPVQGEPLAGSRAAVHEAAAALLASATAPEASDGAVDIVQAEEKLWRRAAVATYAEDCARRASEASAHTTSGNARGEELGAVSPVIAQGIPYALQDAQPRGDAQPAVPRGAHLVRRDRNRSASPWWSSSSTAKDHASPSPEPNMRRGQGRDRHLYDGPVPYDTTASSGDAYPNTPPVGVQCGVMQRHRLTRPAPAGCTTAQARCLDDTDTLALKRARMTAARKSAERPTFLYGTEKSPSTAMTHGEGGEARQTTAERPPAQAHKVLRYSMEARWKRQEETQRHTGRARIAQPPHSTALW